MGADVPLSGALVLAGAGKMGGAMLKGWLERGVPAGRIVVLDPTPPAEIERLMAAHGLKHNPALDQIDGVDVLVLAIKPQMFEEVLPGLGQLGAQRPLVLSIAAGRTIAGIEHHFGADAAIIRAMPNLPAAIGRGITAVVANRNVSTRQLAVAEGLLQAVGEVVTIDDEALMDAVTGVSGSGPAYVFYLTECMTEAGMAAGLPQELASRLARATVTGAGTLMHQSGQPAGALRESVTSPQGTTYEALSVLMADDGLKPLIARTVAAAAARSRKLAR